MFLFVFRQCLNKKTKNKTNEKLLELELMKKRDDENENLRDKLEEGMEVSAEWIGVRNWYVARIDQILDNGKFLVTFLEYEDQNEITIGQIKLNQKNKSKNSHSSHNNHKSSHHSNNNDKHSHSHSHSGHSNHRSNSRSPSRSRSRRR